MPAGSVPILREQVLAPMEEKRLDRTVLQRIDRDLCEALQDYFVFIRRGPSRHHEAALVVGVDRAFNEPGEQAAVSFQRRLVQSVQQDDRGATVQVMVKELFVQSQLGFIAGRRQVMNEPLGRRIGQRPYVSLVRLSYETGQLADADERRKRLIGQS